jgi:hypothetical protein
MALCGHCERLMLEAIEASRVYHVLLGELESAHIRHDTEQPFRIQQQVANALRDRDEAIRVLNDHERSHKSAPVRQMAAGVR